MIKMNSLLLVLSVFFLDSCYESIQGEEVKHIIVKKFRVTPVSIHDEMSPKFRAVLENGDTVRTGENSRVGDTVSYIYLKR
jgi:hypothetical protein